MRPKNVPGGQPAPQPTGVKARPMRPPKNINVNHPPAPQPPNTPQPASYQAQARPNPVRMPKAPKNVDPVEWARSQNIPIGTLPRREAYDEKRDQAKFTANVFRKDVKDKIKEEFKDQTEKIDDEKAKYTDAERKRREHILDHDPRDRKSAIKIQMDMEEMEDLRYAWAESYKTDPKYIKFKVVDNYVYYFMLMDDDKTWKKIYSVQHNNESL